MSTPLKIVLVVVVSMIFLVVAGVVSGIYWWRHHSQEYLEAGKKAIVEGREFGGQTDSQGCVSEALARYKKSPGFSGSIYTNLFLRGCLDTCRSTVGFCDGVPKRTEFVKSAQWQIEQCSDAQIRDNYCGQIFGQVQEYCESEQTESTGAPSREQLR